MFQKNLETLKLSHFGNRFTILYTIMIKPYLAELVNAKIFTIQTTKEKKTDRIMLSKQETLYKARIMGQN